ncbi:TetR family transcriptional regulator [Mycolicibacterium litorale]|nr:TetR family transcriptional regulator [Mycolicibacterium litorale]
MLKEQLVEVAATLLATSDRPELLTLRQVARAAGIAPASIYGHFPNLGALVAHVLSLRYSELAQLMDEAAEGAHGPLANLVARCAAYVAWAVEQPGNYRTLFSNRMPTDVVPETAHSAGAEILASVSAALAAVTDANGMRSEDDHWRAGLLLWTALHGLVSLYNDHGDLPWPPLNVLTAELLGRHTGEPPAVIITLLPQNWPRAAT